ncbi:MAG: hypothetical protein HN981_00705 [Candidatus Pacebacteria bacterium]|jgi:hypothetical protein|nr:hypothetical protein [Candidatus Paceibacterota bacterium]MBT4652202.1 hypothetical protein [Candidatus Paceibacterota bacterium]MBT6756633.1 hypothetical protein [Candidatus Paceibacterota bacterium]MBT6920904.1 hypothetical protein [Candidatus Paceibacterota bacterium]
MLEEQKIQINNDKRQSDLEEMRSLARKLLESFKNESKEFLKENNIVILENDIEITGDSTLRLSDLLPKGYSFFIGEYNSCDRKKMKVSLSVKDPINAESFLAWIHEIAHANNQGIDTQKGGQPLLDHVKDVEEDEFLAWSRVLGYLEKIKISYGVSINIDFEELSQSVYDKYMNYVSGFIRESEGSRKDIEEIFSRGDDLKRLFLEMK